MARLTSDLQYYTLLHPEPRALLTQINKILCERAKRGMFVTLVYILLDTAQNQIKIANAGHMPPIYSDDESTHLLGHDSKKGLPLGIIPDVEYEQEIFELKKNSSVTIYTDGVIEAKNYKGELFDIKRLINVIETQSCDPELIVKAIINAVDKFTLTEGRSDDLTLLAFSRN